MAYQRGFTLIELIGVIVIISVGMLGVAKLFATTNLTLSRATDEQVMSQYAQECAETILKTRRVYGMTSINTMMCNPAPTNYVRIVNISTAPLGTTTSACPNTISCQDVKVTVCAGSTSPCPDTVATAKVTLMLVPY